MRIALDIDGVISAYPQFFAALTNGLKGKAEIFILSNRDPSEQARRETEKELEKWGIWFEHLIISGQKSKVILENGIQVVFENEDEQFQDVPKSVMVLKVREEGNFDFGSGRWVYDKRTGYEIEGRGD